jgi:hypothetical protein
LNIALLDRMLIGRPGQDSEGNREGEFRWVAVFSGKPAKYSLSQHEGQAGCMCSNAVRRSRRGPAKDPERVPESSARWIFLAAMTIDLDRAPTLTSP